jgi:metallophosphoesterase superfamily enzyme
LPASPDHSKFPFLPNSSSGSLVHSADFLDGLSIPVILTEDNHGARAQISKRKFPFQIVPELLLDRVAIPHDPTALTTGSLGIVGRLHPGARSAESPRRSIRVPSFFFRGSEHLILPVFSEFNEQLRRIN